jgi:hypothetical protein
VGGGGWVVVVRACVRACTPPHSLPLTHWQLRTQIPALTSILQLVQDEIERPSAILFCPGPNLGLGLK